MGAETTKEAWDTLKIKFQGDLRVKDLVNQIKENGGEFPDKRVVEKIMVSVPNKFESKILAIEETCDLDTMTINELINKLKAHEQRLTLKSQVVATEVAFQARQKRKHVATSSNSKSSYDSLDKGNLVETQTQPVNYSDDQQGEDHLFLAVQGSSTSSKDFWYVDNGCISHMAKNEDYFIEIDKSVKTRVKLGNGSMVQTQGKGTIAVQNPSGVKWVYRSKLNVDGSLNKYKARLVVKGYAQQLGVDFGETFSPVARHDTIRLLLALAAQKKWKLLVSLYVDDLLVIEGDTELLQKFKAFMQNEFEMIDLGEMKYFMGMEVMQCSNEIFVAQEKYAKDILRKFRMDKCKPIATPLAQNLKLSKDDDSLKCNASFYKSLIGSLLYPTTTRPDLMFTANLLSRYMTSASQTHFSVAKRVLRYVNGTVNYEIMYKSTSDGSLQGYVDSDWAGCPDDSKSTRGYAFSFGSRMFC
ncbi:hypothetical protein SLEP1_g35244 [Rubroshorea leprosula]|uniref:Reverse transcriptase Ty1/copia-type domain-containing protein n=1 Tax=Rubroshorea leprosula TaxID=152421 RepID=A0AAV5KMN1_9ROSI|nr:hypothetical protein SLEP1_g35244 [Rubroshorea leprosula]